MTKTTATTQLTPDRAPRNLREQDEYGDTVPGQQVAVGDFVQTTLVTDTVVYEVVDISPSGKTITLRPTGHGEVVERESNGSPYPITYSEALPNEDAETFTVRRSKRGYFGGGKGGRIGRSLVIAHRIDGKPVKRVDYSF